MSRPGVPRSRGVRSVATNLVFVLVAVLVPSTAPAQALAVVFVVNSTGNQADASVGDGTCDIGADTPSPVCTLRAAIQQANAVAGADTITFKIGEGGPATIMVPDPGLPAITDSVTIDGTTQLGYGGQPLIELTWVGTASAGVGLLVSGGKSVIKALAVTGFGNGVQFDTNGENQIRDSFIGTVDGVNPKSNFRGIRVSSCCNLIGPNNVISGNEAEGIQITGSGAQGNQVFTNRLGTAASGDAPLGNNAGLTLENGATGNLINANTIAANQIGIVVDAPANRVMDNVIGGLSGLGNVAHGIQIVDDNTIVGVQADGAGLPNQIIGNGANGVQVLLGVGNRISRNVIRDNGSLGINLGNDLVTPNDTNDPDTGPNDFLNFPVLSAEAGGVAASFDGPPVLSGTLVTIEFYSVTSCDPANHGEGDTFVASQGGIADGSGDVLVSFPELADGTYTALAIAVGGNTSEFSQCVTLPNPTLFGVESGTDSLSVIDPATGAVTLVGKLGGAGEYATPIAMAVHPTSGELYVWNNTNPNHSLATVNRCTGAATSVGSGGQQMSALAFSSDGTLFGLSSALYQINPTTGGVTPVGSGFGGPVIAAADFGPDGVLYGVELTGLGVGERLFTINTTSGTLTTVGTLSTQIGVIGSLVLGPDGTLIGSGLAGPDGPEGDILFDIDRLTAQVSKVRSLSGWAPQGMGFSAPCAPVPDTVGFSLASSTGLEGTTHLVDVVLSTLGGTLPEAVTVTVGDAGSGTASVETDYALDVPQVTFAAGSGDGAVGQIQLTLGSDSVIEPTETIDLQITAVTGPADLDPVKATHQVSIVDTSLGEGIAFNAVDPSGGGEFPTDGPPIFPALGFIPFGDLDPLAAVRTGSAGAAEELESVGSGIAAIGSGIAAIGSGIAAIGSGIAAIGSGIAAIGSGIAAIDPPLSTIPITAQGDSWEDRLVGTVFEGSPLQSITLSQVANAAPGALAGLTLDGIDYSGSTFGSLALASITVANLTLGSVFATQAECDAAFVGTTPPTNCLGTTVIEADVAGADMRAIGSGIAAIAIASIDLDLQPIGTTTIGAIGSGIAAIELVFDCIKVDCSATSTVTLAQAQNLGAIKLTLLGELYLLLLPVSSYDWTQMPVDLLQVDVGPVARYDLTFVRQGTGLAESTVEVELPVGVHYEPGTVMLAASDGFGNPLAAPSLGEPAVTGQVLTWTFVTSPGVRYDLSFRGRINVIPLGVHRASAQVTTGVSGLAADDAAPITVIDNFENNNSPSSAGPIDDTGLFVSYLPTGSDEDYFKFAIPGGQLAKVLLSHLDEDFDLIYYEPTNVTEASSRAVSEFGPTTPPLDDEGRHTGSESIDPEAADDLDLESIGSGIAAIGSGIAAIGSNRGTDGEVVEGTSDGQSGIRVAGYNSASSDEAYLLQLKFATPFDVQCAPLTLPVVSPGTLPVVPANVDTLILWNAQRTEAIYGSQARTDMAAALAGLAQELVDLGQTPVVIPVDAYPAVRAAYTAWDLNPCSASGANTVVAAINDLVDTLGLSPPQLTSITLIGGDAVVPYERRIDLTDIANEREYGPALQNVGSGPQAGEFGALSGGWVLSNDAYAAFTSIYDWLGHRLYLPDVAVGRLVELPNEIIASIGQFITANGVLNPSTAVTDLDALVSGYDFLSDGAHAQADALDANYDDPGAIDPPATDRLINDFWDALGLETALFPATGARDVVGLGAHFDHQRLFPADIGAVGSQPAAGIAYSTGDLLANALSASLAGRVIFSVGCHSGLTVPDGITLPGGGSTTDWAQAFSSAGAAFVGNSGFGYGLDGAVGLSEKLMVRFNQRLDGSFFLGDALASAKREHFAQQLVYGPYDEKILAESTLFGFPFWRLTGDIIPTGDDPPGSPPAGPQQLAFTHTLSSTANGSYYTTGGQATELFHRPIQPQTSSDFLTTDGTRATGVVIRGLTSRDETPFDPAFARPIVDLASREPELETPGTIFPNVFASTNSRETADGTVSTVILATGQFIGEGQGVQRLFTDMNVEVLFGNQAGSAPEIILADAELSNPSVTFTVVVAGPADEVLVLYKPAGFDVGETNWSTQALTEVASGVWAATVEGVSDQIEWFAQVRRGSFVSTSFNKGVLFAARLVDAGADATVVEGDIYGLSGAFLDPTGATAHTATVDWGDGTPSDTATIGPIPDSTARSISATHVYTDNGTYQVEVCVSPLGEGTECDTATVTVVNAEPAFDHVDVSFNGGTAHIAAGFADPSSDDTHTAVVDWGDGTTSTALVDPATRTLFASHTYSGTDPTTVKITVTVTDDDGGSLFFEVVNGNVAPVVGPVTGPTDPVVVQTTVPIVAAFADFDATGGYTAVIDWGDGMTPTAGAASFDAVTGSGVVTGDHTYTAAGVYTVTVTVTDSGGASGSDSFEFVVVYDPDAGFVTGGGWINSPAGAYVADSSLTGKAGFGFVSRYKKGASVPSGVTQFRFHAASFEFFSDTFHFLVISGGRAQYQGVGNITGVQGGFKFKLTALDADVNSGDAITEDGVRMKIWFEDAAGEHIVYDSGLGATDADFAGTLPLGGGSITIHSGKEK